MRGYKLYEYVVMIVAVILILGASVVAVIQTIGRAKERKEKVAWIKKAKAYENAPVKEVIIHDSIIVEKTVYLKPKPTYHEPAKPSVSSRDSISQACTSEYSVPVKFTEKGLTWRFLATYQIKDCFVETMEISDAVLPKEIIIRTKSVDTCVSKPPLYIPKSHWGLFGGANINSFKRFPGLDLNIIYMYKDKWGLYGGVAYINPNKAVSDAMGDVSIWNNMYLRVGGMIYFK